MKSTALCVLDVPFLYHAILTKKNSKLNYQLYLNRLKDLDPGFEPLNLDLRLAVAYCNQNNKAHSSFRTMLQSQGIEVKSVKYAHGYNLVLETVEMCPNVDTVVLGSTATYLLVLVRKLKEKGKKVIVFSHEVPEQFSRHCQILQIPDTYLIPNS